LQVVEHVRTTQLLILDGLFEGKVGGVEADQAVAEGPFLHWLVEDDLLREDDKIQVVLDDWEWEIEEIRFKAWQCLVWDGKWKRTWPMNIVYLNSS
jgi:hypothetical protein